MNATLIAQFTVPGTTATITVEKINEGRYYTTVEAPHTLGGYHSCGRDSEEQARKAANGFWQHVVELRNRNQEKAASDQQVPGLPGVTYGAVAAAFSDHHTDKAEYARREQEQEHAAYRAEMAWEDRHRDANLAAATGTTPPRHDRYATVRALRQEAKKVLAELVPDHDKFRVAVLLDPADKLRFFQLDMPLKGKWVGCLFLKEQASDELYKVRDVTREEAVLRAVIADAKGALTRYGLELGSCGMCGRTLTDEESRARGIGPVCADKAMGW